jgi:hypothetical protein
MLGNLVAQTATSGHAEPDVLHPVTTQPNGRSMPGFAE